MTRDQINLCLSAMLAAGQDEGIDGHCYAAVMGHVDLDTWQTAKTIAVQAGIIKETGANTFQNTDKGNALWSQLNSEKKVT